MATTDPTAQALAELDRLTRAFNTAQDRVEKARGPLHEAIVRHLRERSARPGVIAEHTPYDRNHVGALGRAAGVPPVKGKGAAGPPPVYDPAIAAEALAELDRLTKALTSAEEKVEKSRGSLHEAIVRHLRERSARPGVIAEHTPYDRNHVGKLGRAAGVPPVKGKGAAGAS
ncbi:hypothetical protein OG896_24765 [Streptomyces sp. NBC_00669]|uniref:hypothetical protein n=1 Tax=Streptomyces sp. NBC_00669 TaxID=2976011 RepID=UPI002E35880F|nr:hypothetical protein [Streptomyces sp. NBC_00669]